MLQIKGIKVESAPHAFISQHIIRKTQFKIYDTHTFWNENKGSLINIQRDFYYLITVIHAFGLIIFIFMFPPL